MFYSNMNINGSEFQLAVNITGKGEPTTSTEANVGMLYMDTESGALYKCTAAADGVYTWVPVGGGALSARIGEVTLRADGWYGETHPYYQVVELDVTENSQVDLTPSVEQLAVFYDKSLGFVAENDGGMVTVYAIGQKPENDYTIQVTITEVAV